MLNRNNRRARALSIAAALAIAALPICSLADSTDLPATTPAPVCTAAPDGTAMPPETTPEPSPTPIVYPLLEMGAQGNDVLALQNRLVELGYLTYSEGDSPGGLYEPLTRNAVKAFQAQCGLPATGNADDMTQQRLYAPDAPAYVDPNATPTASPMPTPEATPGASPEASPIPSPEASPGASPEASPMPSPEVSPGASPEASPMPSPEVSPGASPEASPMPSPLPTDSTVLAPGAQGEAVLALQTRLVQLGYLTLAEGEAPGGLYDEATAAAVAMFQTAAQLEATGTADEVTQQRLYAEDAPAYVTPQLPPMPSWPQGGGYGGMPGNVPAIIPGKALTSSHDRGDKSMTPHGAVDMDELTDEPMTELTIDGQPLAIALEGAAQEFSAASADGVLSLTCAQAGTWRVNGYALRTLAKSGIERIELTCGESAASLDTGMELTGDAYAALRMQGYVSQHFDYLITPGAADMLAVVDDMYYTLDYADGAWALTAVRGDAYEQ